MKLLFKQRFLSWLDSYDIYAEDGSTLFQVESRLSWGHRLHILDAYGQHVGTVRQRLLTFLPKFDVYLGEDCLLGSIEKDLNPFRPHYRFEGLGWEIRGSFPEWDYEILGPGGELIATVSKQLWNFTDTYVLDVVREENALPVLMFTLAIDAEKCSPSND